jgi:hypothetical protein
MKSHEFAFTVKELGRAILPLPAIVFGLVVLLRLCAAQGWLPEPAIASSPDRTVLAHQYAAAKSRHPAEVILTGDSTCLMGVDARALGRALPGNPRALNLALTIGFGLDVYSGMVSNFAAANPGQVKQVVLLVSPARIDGRTTDASGVAAWRELTEEWKSVRNDPLASRALRERLFRRILRAPLSGRGAEYFGFSSEMDEYMSAHDGSLVEFGRFQPRHDGPPAATWKLSAALERESRAFRQALPEGTVVCVGLTPGPASTVAAGAAAERDALLLEWNQWLRADVLLTNLPVTLPDALFSPTAHLNDAGQRVFTAELAKALTD